MATPLRKPPIVFSYLWTRKACFRLQKIIFVWNLDSEYQIQIATMLYGDYTTLRRVQSERWSLLYYVLKMSNSESSYIRLIPLSLNGIESERSRSITCFYAHIFIIDEIMQRNSDHKEQQEYFHYYKGVLKILHCHYYYKQIPAKFLKCFYAVASFVYLGKLNV